MADLKNFASKRALAYPLSIGLHLMTFRQKKQKVAVLFTKMSTPLDRATPKAENTSGSTGCIYPANLVSIAARVSEIWITQYFPIDLNVKKIQPPAPGAPMDRSSPNYLVPVPGVCSTLSQIFTPIAPSCVEISSTVQTKKNSKLNITPNATLYGEITRAGPWRGRCYGSQCIAREAERRRSVCTSDVR